MIKTKLGQLPTGEEIRFLDSIVPKTPDGNINVPEDSDPFGIIKLLEINALCCIVNDGGSMVVKFCDGHGKMYDSIFGYITAKLQAESKKDISINYVNNKMTLSDSYGNIIIQSDIDPELVVRLSNTNLKLEEMHPELMDPDTINKILNSESVKDSIIKHMSSSTKVMEAKTVSAKPSSLDSDGGNVYVGVVFRDREYPEPPPVPQKK